jgi:hypothetical protein
VPAYGQDRNGHADGCPDSCRACERALDRALDFIVSSQEKNGSWKAGGRKHVTTCTTAWNALVLMLSRDRMLLQRLPE